MTTDGGAGELAMTIARLSQSALDQSSAEDTLQGIVELAARTVPGATSAGVAVLRPDATLETLACTDDLALTVDDAQSRLREGPGLSAAEQRREAVVRVDDMATERRWPGFAREAARLGIGSMITCGLRTEHGAAAALSLHSSAPRAFDEAAAEMASSYAAPCSAALHQASLIASLRTAMISRQLIGEATGILMERHRVDSRRAFGMLVQRSQGLNVKLRVVAEYVVRTGLDPDRVQREELQPR